MFRNNTDNQPNSTPTEHQKNEEQPNLLKYLRFTLMFSLLAVAIVLAVVQWGLHKIEIEGQKKISEWTDTPSGFEDEVFEVPEDTVTYRTSKDTDVLIFVTYTKFNPNNGQTYVGKSKGFGEPNAIVKRRDRNHHRNKEGFLPAVLDKFTKSQLTVRGREQQMIDYFGGAWSDRNKDGKPTKSANKIRGVSKDNPAGIVFHNASNREFGEKHYYTGN